MIFISRLSGYSCAVQRRWMHFYCIRRTSSERVSSYAVRALRASHSPTAGAGETSVAYCDSRGRLNGEIIRLRTLGSRAEFRLSTARRRFQWRARQLNGKGRRHDYRVFHSIPRKRCRRVFHGKNVFHSGVIAHKETNYYPPRCIWHQTRAVIVTYLN